MRAERSAAWLGLLGVSCSIAPTTFAKQAHRAFCDEAIVERAAHRRRNKAAELSASSVAESTLARAIATGASVPSHLCHHGRCETPRARRRPCIPWAVGLVMRSRHKGFCATMLAFVSICLFRIQVECCPVSPACGRVMRSWSNRLRIAVLALRVIVIRINHGNLSCRPTYCRHRIAASLCTHTPTSHSV
jgi:hypothetical protein